MDTNDYNDSILNIYSLMKQLKISGFIKDFKLTNSSEKMSVSIDITPIQFFDKNLTVNINVKEQAE